MVAKTMEETARDRRRKTVVDVRRAEDFLQDTYPDAINLPLDEFDQKKDELPREYPVYLLCYNGKKSAALAEELQAEGYEAYNIEQGYYALVKYRMRLAEEAEKAQGADARCKEIERTIIKTYRKELWRKFTRAINEYEMIADGDRIAVCISGGKDSTLMAKLFQELLRHGRHNFDVVFLSMNPGYNDLNAEVVQQNARALQIPLTTFDSDIYDVAESVKNEKGSPCYLCARMRRGALYAKAQELGCNKIALGHHYDDVIETILMGMLYGGQIQTMMPKLHSTNFAGMELIRPMYLIRERDVKRWRDLNGLQFIRCACRLTESCDIEEDASGIGHKRAEIKRLIEELTQRSPYIESNIFKSVENVHLGAVVQYKDKDGARKHFLDDYDKENR